MRFLLLALLTCQLAAAPRYVKRGYIVGEALYEEVGAEVVYHDDVEDWETRVIAAGGSVSTSTLEALDTFADAIETAGIRAKFYRLNVFAGDDLTTALVPFYVGPVTGGTEYGYQYDQNNGPFSGADWSEDSGLQGDGSSYLDTSLTTNDIGTAFGHLSIGRPGPDDGVSNLLGAHNSVSDDTVTQIRVSATYTGSWFVNTQGAARSGTGSFGHVLVSREAADSLSLYDDAVEVATNTNTDTGESPDDLNLYVMALNDDGSASDITSELVSGYSYGLALTPTQVTAYTSAWATLQTALGR